MGQQATHTRTTFARQIRARKCSSVRAPPRSRTSNAPHLDVKTPNALTSRAKSHPQTSRRPTRDTRAHLLPRDFEGYPYRGKKTAIARARDDKTQPRDHRIHPAPRAMRRVLFRPRETTTGLKIRRREFKGKEERERTHHDGTSFLRVCVQRSFRVLYKLRSPFL